MMTIQCSLPFRAACICIWAASALLAQQNLTVTGSQCSSSQQAVNSITTSGNCTFSGSASVKFEAGGSIVLMPGFSAQASGSNTLDAVVVPQAVAPALTSPASGASGPALSPQTFTLTFSDTLGAADISSFQVSFGGTGAVSGICSLSYAGSVLGLWSNDASQLYTTPPLQNSQCSIGSYQVTRSGTTLTFTVPITFQTSFEGSQEVYALGMSSSGDYHPWVDLGFWTVLSPTLSTQVLSSPGTYYWTPATGVTSVQVEAWGPGGNGANAAYFSSGYMAGGGGGGGAYAKKTSAAVTAGQPYTIAVGAAGSTTKTTFAGNIVVADSGVNGALATAYYVPGLGGPGGQASSSVGDLVQSGGNGGNAPGAPYGGSGGAGADGGPGGYGGGSPNGNGTPGAAPGGGGGGAASGGAFTGGAGANGQLVLTIAGPAGTITGGGTYSLTTSVSPSGGGTISPACPGGCSYSSGSQVTISATPASGYQFSGFIGVDSSNGSTGYVTMNGNRSVTANFIPQYQLTTGVSPAGAGAITPATGYYNSGAVPVTVTANTGHAFQSFSGNCTVTGMLPNFSINLTGPCSITANFVSGYTISGTVTSGGVGLSGATVTATGSQTASTTSASGSYALPAVPAGGNYTVSASKTGYNFNPAETSFSSLAANQTANFTAAPATTYTATSLADLTNCLQSSQFSTCILAPGTYMVNSTINIGRYGVTLSGGTTDRAATRLVRGSNFTGQMVLVNITDSSGQTLTMSQAGETTGVVIQTLTFCGGGNTHPNTGPDATLPAVMSPAGSLCGDQHMPTTPNPCGYGVADNGTGPVYPVCTDLAVESAAVDLNPGSQDLNPYPTNPFAYGGPYAVELSNIDLEDAAGHALMLWATAAPNPNNYPPRKVNDIWIHNSTVNYSAITGIGIGVNNVIYTNKYIDSYWQHNPYAFRDDPALFAPRNIRIEGNTLQFNNTGATFGGAVRWLGIRDNTYYVNYISPQARNNAGGGIAISASSDQLEISGNKFTGPNAATGMPPSPPSGYTSFQDTSALELYASNMSIHDNTITGYGYEGIGAFSLLQSTISNNHILRDNNWSSPSGGIDIGSNFPGSACEDVPRDTNGLTIQTNDSNPAVSGVQVGPATQAYGVLLEDHGAPNSTDRLIGVTVTADNFQGAYPMSHLGDGVYLDPWVGFYSYSGVPYSNTIPTEPPVPRFLPVDVPSASSSASSFSPLWPVPPRCPELQPPPAGSSNGSSRAMFKFSASDPNGAANIVGIWGLFSVGGSDTDPSSPVIVASAPDQGLCQFMYDAVNNLVYLGDDNGGWLGPSAVGSGGSDLATPGGCIIHAGSSTSWLSLGRPQAVPTAYVHDLTLDVTLPTSQINKYHLYGYTENLNYNFDACKVGPCPGWNYWGYWWNTQ